MRGSLATGDIGVSGIDALDEVSLLAESYRKLNIIGNIFINLAANTLVDV